MPLNQQQKDLYKFGMSKGWSEEKIRAGMRKLEAAPAPAPAPVEAQDAPISSMSDALGLATRELTKVSPLVSLAKGAESLAPELLGGVGQSAEDLQASLLGGIGTSVEGIRQAANFNDPEERARLDAESMKRRQALAKMTENSPFLSSVGGTAGEILPYLLGGGALRTGLSALGRGAAMIAPEAAAVPRAVSALPTGAIATGGLGALSGGAQGYATALTPEEEAAGQRMENLKSGAMLGGALGAAGPGVTQFLTKRLPDAWARVLPEDALDDFLSRTTGKADDTAQLYSDIVRKTKDKISGLQDRFDKAYAKVEGSMWEKAGKPGIPLSPDSLFKHPDLMGSTRELLSSKKPIRDVMDAINAGQRGTGLPIVPYPTATEAIRRLNKIGSDADAPKGAQEMAQALAAELRGNIDEMAQAFPEVKGLQNRQQQISDAWKSMMVPMRDAGEGAPVGTWNAGGLTQKDFEDTFLSGKSGSQLKDLFARVPEVEEDVRKLWGTTRGAQPEIRRELGSSTTRDIMLQNPEERAYATKLSKYLRGGQADEGMGAVSELSKRMGGRYYPLVNLMMPERLARGVLPYGQKARKMTKADKLAAALRATTLGVVPTDDESIEED